MHVRGTGLEPARSVWLVRAAPPDSKSGAFTSFATPARSRLRFVVTGFFFVALLFLSPAPLALLQNVAQNVFPIPLYFESFWLWSWTALFLWFLGHVVSTEL